MSYKAPIGEAGHYFKEKPMKHSRGRNIDPIVSKLVEKTFNIFELIIFNISKFQQKIFNSINFSLYLVNWTYV